MPNENPGPGAYHFQTPVGQDRNHKKFLGVKNPKDLSFVTPGPDRYKVSTS